MNFKLHTNFDIPAEAWNGLLSQGVTHAPFLRHEYLSTWWQTRGGGEWPQDAQLCLVSAERDGQLVGIARIGRTSCIFRRVRDTAKSDNGVSVK